jgi:hypothetical protein
MRYKKTGNYITKTFTGFAIMSQKPISDLHILTLLVISICLLCLFGLFTIHLSVFQTDFPFRKLLIGLTYIISCGLGIFAAFFPKQCSKVFYHSEEREKSNGGNGYMPMHYQNIFENKSVLFKVQITHGHHPACNLFFNHEFRLRNKTFCSGCFGLVLGALLSLIGAVFYFLYGHMLWTSRITIILGILVVALSLLLFHLKLHGFFRVFPNVTLIIGAFAILAGIDYLLHSIVVDILVLLATYFWVWTRIYLSQRTHHKICLACGFKCVSV